MTNNLTRMKSIRADLALLNIWEKLIAEEFDKTGNPKLLEHEQHEQRPSGNFRTN